MNNNSYRPLALGLLLASTLLTGCAHYQGITGLHAYVGEKKSDSELATIVWIRDPELGLSGHIKGVDKVVYAGKLAGSPNITKILPGNHSIEYECEVVNMWADVSVKFAFEAGKYYSVHCQEKVFGYASPIVKDHGITFPKSPAK